MKRIFALLLCAVTVLNCVIAKEITYDFSSKIPTGWSSDVAPNGYETTNLSRGTQFTKSAILTLKGTKNVSKVVITCSSNTDKNSMSVTVNGTVLGKAITLSKENNVEKTFEGATLSGDLTLNLTRAEKSIYIKTIVVTCEDIEGGNDDGGNTGGGNDDSNKLDPNYTYAEPTVVTVSGQTGSNIAYSFVQNNILVECSLGGQTFEYFGCNAGSNITFTATQEIVAIAIDGYVKKEFDAEVNIGDLYFASDDEDYVEQDPVLYIEDINAKSVTISCVKQMRCYNVKFYFKEAPELDLEELFGGNGGWDDLDFTFEYEPTAKTTTNITFEEAYYANYSEAGDPIPMTDLYFVSDEHEMELIIYADMSNETMVTPGTYAIDTVYAKNHVMASIGYSDYFGAMPSYVITDFEQYDGEWYWNTIYHLVGGTVTISKDPAGMKMVMNATSYNGSTINATFVGKPISDDTAITDVKGNNLKTEGKFIQNGQLYIQKGAGRYNAAGISIK